MDASIKTAPTPRLSIDGTLGGGQIVRNALVYSILTEIPVSLHSIRASRRPPGLRPQHLTGVQLMAELAGAEMEVGSNNTLLRFEPPAEEGGGGCGRGCGQGIDFVADTKTAGSITLLVQCALPVLLFRSGGVRETRVVLKGGTNATLAPQIDFLVHIFKPFAATHFGILFDMNLVRRGFYPKGGGQVNLAVIPRTSPIPAITLLDRGTVIQIKGFVVIGGNTPFAIATRLKRAAESRIEREFPNCPCFIEVDDAGARNGPSTCIGSGGGILMYVITDTGCVLAGSAVASFREVPEITASAAVDELVKNVREGGCVDEYMQDQIVVFLALAEGTSKVLVGHITEHTRSAIQLAEKMTGAKFVIEAQGGLTNVITCDGIGFGNKS
ncbi:hypothetical protein HDU98_006966 [Podochytrium sp. JEL0797]|nr:hypothetical protein HDU98_006966 [Podochytrium sp. JEL0797]